MDHLPLQVLFTVYRCIYQNPSCFWAYRLRYLRRLWWSTSPSCNAKPVLNSVRNSDMLTNAIRKPTLWKHTRALHTTRMVTNTHKHTQYANNHPAFPPPPTPHLALVGSENPWARGSTNTTGIYVPRLLLRFIHVYSPNRRAAAVTGREFCSSTQAARLRVWGLRRYGWLWLCKEGMRLYIVFRFLFTSALVLIYFMVICGSTTLDLSLGFS